MPTHLDRRARIVTVGHLVRWYVRCFEGEPNPKRSNSEHLRALACLYVAKLNASTLTADQLVSHVWQRRDRGANAAAALSDLSSLAVILNAAKAAGVCTIASDFVKQALRSCREIRILTDNPRRERRPRPSEILLLDRFFLDRPAEKIPMHDFFWFVIHSARREREICELGWADLDSTRQMGQLPVAGQQRASGDRKFKFTEEAWAIVLRQPRTSQRIFPYDPQSVREAFGQACRALKIVDLSLRDLRYEAALRLFEKGHSSSDVAAITLINSNKTLSTYARIASGATLEQL